MLLCPVRGCHLPLVREEKRLVCERAHSFDVSRRGYVNLLQPQDKRSKHPGDTAEAVAGRMRVHDLGVTVPLLRGIEEMAKPTHKDVVLDAGCGDGFYLGRMVREHGISAHGVDISTEAIEAAAKRYPHCEWIVANADRFIPYAGHSFTLGLSITGRMNPAEFKRVLKFHSRLLVAIPAPDDLIELRGEGRDRAQRTIAEFAPLFELKAQRRVTTHADLDAEAVTGLRHAIYRPLNDKPPEAMRVTFSLDCFLFA
jgi:23S rRNA (guanine745-N1)-methyltransferase